MIEGSEALITFSYIPIGAIKYINAIYRVRTFNKNKTGKSFIALALKLMD